MFRFSIRELALITLAVGLVIGWIIDHYTYANQAAEWKGYAGSLELILSDYGIMVARGREWVHSARGRALDRTVMEDISVRVGEISEPLAIDPKVGEEPFFVDSEPIQKWPKRRPISD
jgi:hypothetical protein